MEQAASYWTVTYWRGRHGQQTDTKFATREEAVAFRATIRPAKNRTTTIMLRPWDRLPDGVVSTAIFDKRCETTRI